MHRRGLEKKMEKSLRDRIDGVLYFRGFNICWAR